MSPVKCQPPSDKSRFSGVEEHEENLKMPGAHTTEPVFMRQLRPIRSSDNPMATAAQAQKKPKRSSLRGLMSYTEMMMRRKMTQLIPILD